MPSGPHERSEARNACGELSVFDRLLDNACEENRDAD